MILTRTYIGFVLGGLVYLLLHCAAAYSTSPLWWGVDSWRYIPQILSCSFIAIWLLAAVPALQRPLKTHAVKIAHLAARIPLIVWLPAGGALLYVLRERALFLGDGYLRAGSIEIKKIIFLFEEPLDMLLHSAVHLAIHPYFGNRGVEVYQWMSIIMGLFAFWGMRSFLVQFFSNSGQQWFIGGLLATSGAVQLFFGYAESYTLVNGFALLFMFSSLLMLRRKVPGPVPMVFLSLAVISHSVGILFFPGALYAYFTVIHGNGITRDALKHWLKPLGVFISIIGLLAAVFWLGGHPPSEFLDTYLHGSNLLPLVTTGDLYGVFSLYHAVDVLNELALLVPALAGFVFVLFRLRFVSLSRHTLFLLICCAGPIAFMSLFNPKLGYARDWDIFALAAFPVTLLCGILIIETAQALKENLFGIGFSLVLISCFHTVPWIWVNSSVQHSLERFELISETPHWSNSSKEFAHDMLASYYFKVRNIEKTLLHNEKAFDLTDNKRYFNNIIRIYVGRGEIEKLQAFIQKDSTNAEGHYGLGMVYFNRNIPEKAREEFEKALSLRFEDPEIYYFLGRTYAMLEQPDESIQAYKEALKRFQDTSRIYIIHNDLGCLYANKGMWDDSVKEFTEAIRLKPDYAEAHLNLGKLYYRTMNDSMAAKHAELARKYGGSKENTDALLKMISARH